MSNNTKENILFAARDEFMAKGFLDASLRTIAREAGVTVSNIYRHYKHKNNLFEAVLKPLLDELEQILIEHNSEQQMELYYDEQSEYYQVNKDKFIDLISNYRAELKLLLTQSAGSSFENYAEKLLDSQVAVGQEYLKKYQEKFPNVNVRNVSPLFMRICSSWWLIMLKEMSSNDLISLQEMEQCISEYMIFGMAGWNAFMNNPKIIK